MGVAFLTMTSSRLLLLLGLAACTQAVIVLVTGATGKTGQLVYSQLKTAGFEVRALVRNATKAQGILNCTAPCTEKQGVFVGDVTKPETLTAAMQNVTRVVSTVGAFPKLTWHGLAYPKGGYPVDVDFHGLRNQVIAGAKAGVKHFLLVSSMGTTQPNTFLDKMGGGQDLFYKLNAEAFLMASGLAFTIVKPGGLTNDPIGRARLLVGHEDSITNKRTISISRADVASVLAHACLAPSEAANTRFDLTSDKSKPATGDFKALFVEARALA